MNTPFVAVRALHFGSAMLVFGELLFVSVVASSAWQRAVAAQPGKGGALERHLQVVCEWALLVSAGSGAVWLAIEAANMAGTTLARAIDARTLALVLRETEFGHVWLLRTLLLVMLALSLVAIRRAADDAARLRRMRVALLLAALYLATLAWAGHAAATMQGALRASHLASDMAHALAAGAWLGALPALVYCLWSAQPNAAVLGITRRFSVLGVIGVSVLLVTGIVNACFLVGSFAALFGTPYGRVLIVKLAVFGAMLALAAVNRWHLTPQLAHGDASARRSLRRSATLEVIGGVAIVAIVGALGTMIPGAHQSPVWPFAFALDLSDIARPATVALAGIALAALILIITGVRRRFARLWIPGSIALLLSAIASGWVLAVPAFPTTYATSPVPYSVDAVARGASTFAQDCSGCHGADARGDGAKAASLPVKPIDLAEHALHHPQGNLFWWIAHGIPDTPMPAFSPALSDTRIWQLVQFLVARASAAAAMSLGPRADAASMSTAPDFSYELPGQGQRTLSAERAPVLIVLYALPQSRARLDELASDHRVLHGSLRVVAIPLAGLQRVGEANALMQTRIDPEVASVYAMFARTADGSRASHVELLLDASGVVRARWSGLPASGSDRDAEILAAVKHLPERSTMPPMMHHAR
jgi:putative copper export protein/mono/diheme cytochrome c family protein